MDDSRPRIIGDRRLPCHGQRARRLAVSEGPVVRSCGICNRRYAISFVPEPHFTARLGVVVYRLEVAPFVDGRTVRRLTRERALEEMNPRLPFGDDWQTVGG